MDKTLMGRILASVVMVAAEAGAVQTDAAGVIADHEGIAALVKGFLDVWLQSPISGATIPK